MTNISSQFNILKLFQRVMSATMNMKKIVVTGAAGLVGQNLIPLLLRKNHRIIAIDRNRNNLGLLKRLNPKINAVNADISSR